MQITESGGIVFSDEKGNTQYVSKEEFIKMYDFYKNPFKEVKLPIEGNIFMEEAVIAKDPIVESVREKLLNRSNVGIKKYGEQLGNYKKYNFIQEMQNEALDFANYCEVELQKELTINQLVEKFSNDQDLGKEIRKLYGK